jgi:hypothetical protein
LLNAINNNKPYLSKVCRGVVNTSQGTLLIEEMIKNKLIKREKMEGDKSKIIVLKKGLNLIGVTKVNKEKIHRTLEEYEDEEII